MCRLFDVHVCSPLAHIGHGYQNLARAALILKRRPCSSKSRDFESLGLALFQKRKDYSFRDIVWHSCLSRRSVCSRLASQQRRQLAHHVSTILHLVQHLYEACSNVIGR